jgi:hypothetical protein
MGGKLVGFPKIFPKILSVMQYFLRGTSHGSPHMGAGTLDQQSAIFEAQFALARTFKLNCHIFTMSNENLQQCCDQFCAPVRTITPL